MKKKNLLTVVAVAAIAVSAQAQQVIKLEPGISYTLTSIVDAAGIGVTYQWYRNNGAIAGATSATYTLPASEAHGVNEEFKRGAKSPSCSNYSYSNAITISFCNTNLSLGNVCWARTNVDSYQQFASVPDMYTKFYQWNRSTAYSASDPLTPAWNSTANTSSTWTINPCPTGWRIPTTSEYAALNIIGSTWAAPNSTRGNSTPGRFYGPNHNNSANCKLPSPMTNCIFLPTTNYRNTSGTLTVGNGTGAVYWTTSDTNYFGFNNTESNTYNGVTKAQGNAIRCVQ